MRLNRLRMDELVNAWVGGRTTPFQMGLLAVFEPGPFAGADGSVDVDSTSLPENCQRGRRASRSCAAGSCGRTLARAARYGSTTQRRPW